jgi:L-methionine (R)-S-oxide reductase
MKALHVELLETCRGYLAEEGLQGLSDVCTLLQSEAPKYDWVGFYWMDTANKELFLGPFAGAPTDHVRIPFGVGICGQVAISGKTLRVDDVSQSDNYLACSMETRSELVVPISVNGELVGQLDIDSHTLQAFSEDDLHFCELLCALVASVWEPQTPA